MNALSPLVQIFPESKSPLPGERTILLDGAVAANHKLSVMPNFVAICDTYEADNLDGIELCCGHALLEEGVARRRGVVHKIYTTV